nr:hypothetical protein [Tanacetum cinerariifolium]
MSFVDEPVHDSNPNSYNQTHDFSNPLPHPNYETNSRSDTGAAFQVEFAKLQQNFERFMDQQSCSYRGGPFNDDNCPSYSIVGAENKFFHDPNPFLTIIHLTFMTNHHNTISRHTRASYVGTILTMVMIVHHGYRLSMSRNRATIKTLESDEVIKSSVEDFVPIPSESEDTSGSDSECDLPSCDDFSPINVLEGKYVTFSNPLFNSNDDFTSGDDESLSDEDVPEDYSHLFFDSNEDECFDPGGDVDEINAFDILSDFEDGYYDSEGDVLYLESLISDDTTLNLPLEGFRDHDPRSLSDINDLKIMVKVFDPGIPEKFFSPRYVSLPFKDRHYLYLTYVIRIFLPHFTYLVDSPFLLSSRSEDTIFDPTSLLFIFLLWSRWHLIGVELPYASMFIKTS